MESASEQSLQQLMFSLIEIWKSGGKSQQEFCREKDLDYNKFQYWLRKYKRSNLEAGLPVGRRRFTRIKVKERPAEKGILELIFPDGRKLIFHHPVEACFVRSMLG
jgi:hypothetical protein